MKKYREALDSLSNLPDKGQTSLIYIAAAHAYLGENGRAAKALQEAKDKNPGMTRKQLIAVTPEMSGVTLEHLFTGLRMAGLTD